MQIRARVCVLQREADSSWVACEPKDVTEHVAIFFDRHSEVRTYAYLTGSPDTRLAERDDAAHTCASHPRGMG
jgi:hypothetical protein